MYKMDGMNIELTTCCPLHCPQCYCTLEGGKHIDLDVAKSKIDEAAKHGVYLVQLSGGETICYPHLFDLVAYASNKIKTVNVALSGWHFNHDVIKKLIDSNVGGIYISLNGSTNTINSVTRDGYEYALNALKIMKEAGYRNSFLNWVMHSNNCDDFENVVRIAEDYSVSNIVVLVFKPDSSHQLLSFPSGEQIHKIAQFIKSYRGPVKIMVETCFSQLMAILKDTKLFGNLNLGPTKGCRAGIYNYSINVDGMYSPCRHLDYYEDYESLDVYLEESDIIRQIRNVETYKEEPCASCGLSNYCKPCLAVNSKLENKISIGNGVCDLWNR